MGLTVLEVEIGNPANPEVAERLDLLVDSGAVYSVVPSAVLTRLGIRALREEEFRLADGSRIRRQKGIALFKYGNRIGALGFALDPLRRELKPLPMILSTGA